MTISYRSSVTPKFQWSMFVTEFGDKFLTNFKNKNKINYGGVPTWHASNGGTTVAVGGTVAKGVHAVGGALARPQHTRPLNESVRPINGAINSIF